MKLRIESWGITAFAILLGAGELPVLRGAEDPAQIAETAFRAMQQENYPEAERLYSRLKDFDPNIAEVQSNLGLARYFQSKFNLAEEAFQAALRLNPGLFVPNYFLGSIYADSKKLEQALPLAERAVKADPKSEDAGRLLAAVLFDLKRYGPAISQYHRVLRGNPRDTDALHSLALIYLERSRAILGRLRSHGANPFTTLVLAEYDATKSGMEAQLSGRFREALNTLPRVMGLRAGLARQFIRLEKWQDAKEAFAQELAIDPFSYDARTGMAELALREGRLEVAVRYLNEAVRIRADFFNPLPESLHVGAAPLKSYTAALAPDGACTDFGGCLILFSAASSNGLREQASAWKTQAEKFRNLREAEQESRAKAVPPPAARQRTKTGLKYLREKRYEEAFRLLRPFAAGTPPAPEARIEIARALFARKRFEDAIRLLEKVPGAELESIYLLGTSYKNSAFGLMERIVEIDPESVASHQLVGDSLSARNRWEQAAQEYEVAVKSDPRNPELYWALGNAYFRQMKFEAASDGYRRAIELNPYDPRPYLMRGYALVQLRRSEDAIPLLRRALELDHSLLPAHAHLGKALAQIGQLEPAATELELAAPSDKDGRIHYQLFTVYRKLGMTEKAQRAMQASEKLRQEYARNIEQERERYREYMENEPAKK